MRCSHGRGRALCFECFTAGSARTRARQDAWAQKVLPFEDADPAPALTTTQVAHRKRMLEYLESMRRVRRA